METLINLFCYYEKVFIHMNAWIVGKYLMKHHCLTKKFFIATYYITDVGYRHAKRVFKNLSNKNLGDYHDLYVQSDILLFANVFENFRNMCIKVYEVDPAHIFACSRISLASMFKENRSKIRIDNRS